MDVSQNNNIKAQKIALLLESHRGIARLAFRHMRHIIDDHRISVASLPILKLVYEHGTLSQHAIAEHLCITDAAVSRQVRILAKEKLIEIQSSEANQRVSLVALTSHGRQLADEMKRSMERYFIEVLDEMSEEEIDTLATFSQKMLEKLNERRDKEEV